MLFLDLLPSMQPFGEEQVKAVMPQLSRFPVKKKKSETICLAKRQRQAIDTQWKKNLSMEAPPSCSNQPKGMNAQ